ncbi:MAG: hypothetical protein IKZ13_08240 [Akkermansia sp.]|nr:hypothetical protein [Akkermansia sp.]
MLIWLIIVPVIAAALIGLLKAPGRATALVSAAFTLIMGVWAFIQTTFFPEVDINCWSTVGDKELWFSLESPLSRIMLLLSVIVTFAAILGMKAPDKNAERSWAISSLLLSTGAIGAFVSDNIISFYAFHELALIPTFVMIGFYGRGNRRTVAWTATVYLGLASMVLLAGLLMLCSEMRSYTFSGIRMAVESGVVPSACLVPGLLLAGFGTLVSLFPFHAWAAPAYASAPTPIAMLHAGVLKKFGLYGLFTLAYVMGPVCKDFFGCWNNLLLVLLLGNVLWVGYVTVAQTRLDDMLGNSSVMHMGYIFLAFAVYVASNGNNELAIKGAAMLMLAHGLTIALLFLLTGQIESQTRTLELDSMGGLASRLPGLGFMFALAGLASIGLPLLANFAGEFTVFVSCFSGWQPGAAAATTGCDALSSIYNWLEGGLTGIWLIGPVFGWVFDGITATLNAISGWFGGLGAVQIATLFALWGLVISAIYMLRAFRRVFEGNVGLASERATGLTAADKCSAIFLAFFIVLFGVAPFLIFIS